MQNTQQAVERTRDAWTAVLGRPKKSEDVTEFLWGYRVGLDGRAAMDISERAELLTVQEAQATVANLPIENWPLPTPIGAGTGEVGLG
jgi:hypothetical protein